MDKNEWSSETCDRMDGSRKCNAVWKKTNMRRTFCTIAFMWNSRIVNRTMPIEIRPLLLEEAGINWEGPRANFQWGQKCSGPWCALVKTEHLRSEHVTVCRLYEEKKAPQLKSGFLHLNAQGILGAEDHSPARGVWGSWLSTWASGRKLYFSYFLLAKPTKHYLLCLPLWSLGPLATGQTMFWAATGHWGRLASSSPRPGPIIFPLPQRSLPHFWRLHLRNLNVILLPNCLLLKKQKQKTSSLFSSDLP